MSGFGMRNDERSSHSFGAAVATLLAFVDIMRAVDGENEIVGLVGERTALARPKMGPLRRRIRERLSWLKIFHPEIEIDGRDRRRLRDVLTIKEKLKRN